MALGTVLIAGCGSSVSKGDVAAPVVDAKAHIPDGAGAKQTYARVYTLKEIRTDGDLPFTTSVSFRLEKPRRVWLGLFSRFPSERVGSVSIAPSEDRMPKEVHGGCSVVNLIADATTGETLGSWCNANDRPDAPQLNDVYMTKDLHSPEVGA